MQTCDVYHDFILVLTHCHVSMNIINRVVILPHGGYSPSLFLHSPLLLPPLLPPLFHPLLPPLLSSLSFSHPSPPSPPTPSLPFPSLPPPLAFRNHLYHLILNYWFYLQVLLSRLLWLVWEICLILHKNNGLLLCTTYMSHELSWVAILPHFPGSSTMGCIHSTRHIISQEDTWLMTSPWNALRCFVPHPQAHTQEPGDEANTRVDHCHHGDKPDQALLALGYRCTGCSTCRYKQVPWDKQTTIFFYCGKQSGFSSET